MSNGFHGLFVDHASLTQIEGDLRRTVQAIDDRFERLESELSPLRNEWGGQARNAYSVAKASWDRAILEMKAVLAHSGTTVGDANAGYAQSDRTSASAFQQM